MLTFQVDLLNPSTTSFLRGNILHPEHDFTVEFFKNCDKQ